MLFDVLKTGKIVSFHYILDKNMKKARESCNTERERK